MEQRSKEWYDMRRGKFTASNIHKLMGAKGIGKVGETYIYETVADMYCEWKPESYSAAINWGVEYEADAMAYYEIATKQTTKSVGFLLWPEIENAGCSPDRLILDSSGVTIKGVEAKCPYNPVNHVKNYLLSDQDELKKLSPEYYWQVMDCIGVTGVKEWDFVSYHPEFTGKQRMCILTIGRVESEIDLIKERIHEANKMRNNIIEKMKI